MSLLGHRPLLGVNIHDVSLGRALEVSEAWLRSHEFHQVVTVGPEFILEAQDYPKFRRILNQADLALADGMGIKVGFALSGYHHRHRVAGVDYVLGLIQLAEQRGYSVFFLGAGPGVAETAAAALLRQHPKLNIAGIESGNRWPWTWVSNRRVVERIHLAKPDILLVALGAPKQELWIDAHRRDLHDVSIAVGIGRTLDYLAGVTPRAPATVRRLGFEWLHTWLFAHRFHNPGQRRQRVWNATWTFLKTILTT